MGNKKVYTCQYCGGKVPPYSNICSNCFQKRKLIRRIKAMLAEAKKDVEAKKIKSEVTK